MHRKIYTFDLCLTSLQETPTELPTKAPITLRPTPYPTSSIRNSAGRTPTSSPVPTVEVYIVGRTKSPVVGVPIVPVDPNAPKDPGIPITGDAVFMGGPSRMLTAPAEPPAPERVKELRERLRETAEEESGRAGSVRGGGGKGGRAAAKLPAAKLTAAREIREIAEHAERLRGRDGDKVGNLSPPGGLKSDGKAATTRLHKNNARKNGRRLQEAVGASLTDDVSVTGTLSGLVRFEVCPGSVFDFAVPDPSTGMSGPVVIETPSVHGLHVGCLEPPTLLSGAGSPDPDDGAGCLFSGGANHVLVNSDGYSFSAADGDPLYGTSTGASSVTLSGITFEGATSASVLMNDPRGKIRFQDCTWSNNAGEASIVIDGRYVPPTMAPTKKPVDWLADVVVWTGTSSTIDWSIFNFDTTSANMIGDETTPSPGDEEEGDEEEEETDDEVQGAEEGDGGEETNPFAEEGEEDADVTGDIGLDAGEADADGDEGETPAEGSTATQATAIAVADGGASDEDSESTQAATGAAEVPAGEEEAPAAEEEAPVGEEEAPGEF